MTSRDFCYWLQGHLEIDAADEPPTSGLSTKQVDCIRKHLALVFVHEIDPSAGPPEHQKKLDAVHGTKHPADASSPFGPVYRC